VNGLTVQLSAASGVPYYRQIVDQVAQFIRSGQLSPSTRLPSVRELASQLLVSLITIRRSYADLEAAGLIVRRQGQGTFVAEKVEVASRGMALAEGRAALSSAVAHARRLGLRRDTVSKIVSELLSADGHKEGEESRDG
jgi:GntR family transcriptional regulator